MIKLCKERCVHGQMDTGKQQSQTLRAQARRQTVRVRVLRQPLLVCAWAQVTESLLQCWRL